MASREAQSPRQVGTCAQVCHAGGPRGLEDHEQGLPLRFLVVAGHHQGLPRKTPAALPQQHQPATRLHASGP
eukprot:8552269-Lingulodinium_polyedra.AAC.2